MKQLFLLCPEHIDKAEELGKRTRKPCQNDVICWACLQYRTSAMHFLQRYHQKAFKSKAAILSKYSFGTAHVLSSDFAF